MKAILSRFTPSIMPHEDLEAIFVQREKLVDRLVELARDSALTPSKHQALLIGPRGVGKTHIIALVYHRVRKMEDLGERLMIAWLREEEWGVTSFLDLLLRIFRALMEEEEYYDPEIAEQVESLYLHPETAEHIAAKLLREFAGDRALLILAENLEDLFDGLGDEGQKQLRAYLQENPFCTILATAQSLFNGVSLQTSPFYGFFRIHHLEELGLPRQYEAATELAGEPIAAGAATGTARIVRDPTQTADLCTDYILVCHSTDPGWTALFVHARGLVVEQGGVLSHGAIVARDFGIPAVVCHDATRRIPDGATVRVDGNRGAISILEDGPPAPGK